MNSNDPTLQQALQDLSVIRRAIDSASNPDRPSSARPVRNAHFLLQGLAFTLSTLLIVYELLSQHDMATMLQLSRYDRVIGMEGLAEVALCLPFLLAALYFVVWRSAKHSERDLQEFLARNFQYLRNLNFLSDLFVKFVVLSLAVLSGHGEWVPALLTLFMGDYLLQGRFFTIPLALSLVLGSACFAGAGLLYLKASTELLGPLTVFSLLSLISLASVHLSRRGRQ